MVVSVRSGSSESLRTDWLPWVTAFLREHGHELVQQRESALLVDVRIQRSAFLATLQFPQGVRKVVVKPLAFNESVRRADQLRGALARLAASSERLAAALPPVLGIDESSQMLILEYVEGETLERRLRREFRERTAGNMDGNVLREAGRVLRDVHKTMAQDVFPERRFRDNASFLPGFTERAVAFTSAFRRAGFDDPHALLERLSPDFFGRSCDRLGLVDARPKNLIVRSTGGLAFIDLDCAPMSPSLAVATFLVAIDRVGVRHLTEPSQCRVAAWQHAFVEAYCEWSDFPMGEELIFYYPWALLQMFEQHCRYWPSLTPFFRWYYGGRLVRFLRALSQLPSDALARRPAELFRGDLRPL